MTQYFYREACDSISPADAQFQMDQARSHRLYEMDGIFDLNDQQQVLLEVLGSTFYNNTSLKLNRYLPLCDGVWPWLYASSAVLRGKGIDRGVVAPRQASDIALPFLATPVPEYTQYPNYTLHVEFTTRPYNVLTDDFVQLYSGSWVNFAGALQSYFYATEWERYTDFTTESRAESVVGQQGTMTFQSSLSGTNLPNGKIIQNKPRMYLPDQLLIFNWYGVPLNYITSTQSYIRGTPDRYWLGCVNQNAWNGYEAGQLLYMNYKYRKYTPSLPELADNNPAQVPEYQKLCDISFYFLYTQRQLQVGETAGATPNANYVANGWNLQPWLTDRQFHYATTSGTILSNGGVVTGAASIPSFRSFPLELLFTNPDVIQLPLITNY